MVTFLQEHILTGKCQCPQNSSISLFETALARLDLRTPGPRFLVIFRLRLISPVGVDIIHDLGPGARPTTFPSTLRSGSQAG